MQERSGPLCQGMGTFSRFSCSRGVGKGAEVGGEKGGRGGGGKGDRGGGGKGGRGGGEKGGRGWGGKGGRGAGWERGQRCRVGKGAEQSKKTLIFVLPN